MSPGRSRVEGADQAHALEFGVFRLTPESRLLKNGRAIHVRPTERAFLAALVRARGATVKKEALIASGWGPGAAVSDASLARCAYTLRMTLAAEDPSSPYVETVYGEGYRLCVPVWAASGDVRLLVLPFQPARVDAEVGADIVVSGTLSEHAPSSHLDLRVHEVATGRAVNVTVAENGRVDLQALATSMARALASPLPVSGGPCPESSQAQPRVPRAYEAYLEGRYNLRHRTAERLSFAMSRFEMALEWDPAYLPPLLGLIDCHTALGTFALATGAEVLARTGGCMERAKALAPGSRQVTIRRSSLLGLFDWRFDEAVAMLNAVLDADGGDPDTLYVFARVLAHGGAIEQAVKLLEMVTELDPVSSSALGTYTLALLAIGRPSDALASARRAAALAPDSAAAWLHVSRSAAALGLAREALEAADRLKSCDAESPLFRATYAEACARFGREGEARELLATAGHRLAPSAFALAAAALGDLPETRLWLQRALQERDCYLPYLRLDPLFEPARTDPGVATLLARVPLLGAID